MHFIFDLHRTLIYAKQSHGSFLASRIPNIDSKEIDLELGRVLNAIDRDMDQGDLRLTLNCASLSRSESAWTEIFFTVVQSLAKGPTLPTEQLAAACKSSYDRLIDPSNWSCYSDTAEVLHALQVKGYGLSILSNFDFRGQKIVGHCLSKVKWKHVNLSCSSGLLKPDPLCFHSHCLTLGIEPREACMVGDDTWQDGEATKIGMHFRAVDYPRLTLAQALAAYL